MKKVLLRFVFSIIIFQSSIINCSAQWVSIPDTNFGTWLNDHPLIYQCLQGNNTVGWQLDTTCTWMNVAMFSCSDKNLHDLTCIQYFHNLRLLDCSHNQLSFIPELAPSCTTLYCQYNQLSSLPDLPDALLN